MLLLLRLTNHKKLATILGLLSNIAFLALAVVTHNHTLLISGVIFMGLSILQFRHQRREASASASRQG
jgi:D-alanyl-lipoteichoic acid acyltransferase DltB (MBOAT superfamily)